MLSEGEVRKSFNDTYFDGKATIEQVKDKHSRVDMCLLDKNNNPLLYIETKEQGKILNNNLDLQGEFQDKELRSALAQIILTNRQQENVYGIINKVAVAYVDVEGNYILHYATWDDDSVMFNNDINWKGETPSEPTIDAVNRINDRLKGKIATYKNEEIKEFINKLLNGENTQIEITTKNMVSVFSNWKQQVEFYEDIKNEQEFIYLFLTDLAKGEKYSKIVKSRVGDIEISLIKQNTDLAKYELSPDTENTKEIRYSNNIKGLGKRTEIFTFKDKNKYKSFWKTYKRPPSVESFEAILEHRAKLYTDKYRRTTGAEYTPYCFVKKQNELLEKYYGENWQDEYIVYDPCCGVGNLENEFPKDFRRNFCFMSTLEQGDVDTCRIKYFDNAIKFDYSADNSEPVFLFKGCLTTIDKIAKQSGRKLMVIMNPPYQRVKGKKNNLAIEFFNKVCKLQPETIVFYYNTNSFWNDEIDNYIKAKYNVVSHIMSSKKNTFLLTDGPISQIIFDKNKGEKIDKMNLPFDRYEYNNKLDTFDYIKTYTYRQETNLLDDINKKIKDNSSSFSLGQYVYLSNCINLTNKSTKNELKKITIDNLKYCLLSKGINFNTHCKYFEINDYVYKGKVEDIPEELFNDSIMFALYYKGNGFSNRKKNNFQCKNYIMPYTAEELGCNANDLNVLYYKQEILDFDGANKKDETKSFDFREWLRQFEFSKEAKDLYNAGLKIFRYYHGTFDYKDCGFQKSVGADFNDSFYDITSALMGKTGEFQEYQCENDTRINKVKTTKGTKGFGKNTIKKVVPPKILPIFIDFFDKRDILARKINKQLVQSGLLLWERENIY
jgi:hypothetical protein